GLKPFPSMKSLYNHLKCDSDHVDDYPTSNFYVHCSGCRTVQKSAHAPKPSCQGVFTLYMKMEEDDTAVTEEDRGSFKEECISFAMA
ncbi:hypothetical protein PENTCL1PPCAC_27550, partial [Pristionchus entomophagus]